MTGQVDSPTGTTGAISPLIQGMRVQQWVKNLLVFAVPVAAGTLLQPDVLDATVVAFVAFCAAASATYLANDVFDAQADRQHPEKRLRPVARGSLRPGTAMLAAGALAFFALALPAAFSLPDLSLLVAGYLLLQLAYVTWAKHQSVLDLACVATGFVLRAVAGGVAAGLPVSVWFLAVTAAVAMFVVAGKRYSELVAHGASGTRRSLQAYSPAYLRFVWGVSAGVAVVFYGLWAAELGAGQGALWARLSVVPFVLVLLRYAQGVDSAAAQSPGQIVLRDRPLQVLALTWAAMFCAQVIL